MKQTIGFIIVTYHPITEELKALLRVLKDHPIIIVDNAGTLTPSDVGRSTLISQSKNIGFGAAANIGIHHASGLGTDWFVILNQDLRISMDALSALVKQLTKVPAGIVGPITGSLDPKRWTTTLHSLQTDYVSGSCMAIHKNIIGKIGYFYEPYFLYYEDADLCVRATRAGFPISTHPSQGFSHTESVTLGKGTFLHQYYLARNHLLFVKRLAPRNVKLYEMFRAVKTLTEHVVRSEHGAIIGIKDFFMGRFGKIRGRQAQ